MPTQTAARASAEVETEWPSIGVVIGNASTHEFTFILKSFKSRIGDIVAVPMEVPNDDYSGTQQIYAWGRVTSIDRYNPFFPAEAAQELASESIPLLDTVLSTSRDQLEAKVLILGYTPAHETEFEKLYPLTYPIRPAADVRYPPPEAIRSLLGGAIIDQTPLRIGSLIARSDVDVDISAERVVARHLAILAMTGGGKTVAARRVIRALAEHGYPMLILDPHGDYIGLWEKHDALPNTTVKLFYPHVMMTGENKRIVEVLITRMIGQLTPPQRDFLNWLLEEVEGQTGQTVLEYVRILITVASQVYGKRKDESEGFSEKKIGASTINAVRRSLEFVADRLTRMERSNERLRGMLKHFTFDPLPDPEGRPEAIVAPRQISILHLGGYDHLTQSTIVSILVEALFAHRAQLTDRIPPFLAVIEEAHNFIPSRGEGTDETPSLDTLRKVITEGRKFGAGLLLITQRPSRVDETILAQCNTFLVLRLVNPKDQNYVRSVMENLDPDDAKMLPGFGPGQGIISGQAVRFPLLVKIKFDQDIVSTGFGDENFLKKAQEWKPDRQALIRARAAAAGERLPKKRKQKS